MHGAPRGRYDRSVVILLPHLHRPQARSRRVAKGVFTIALTLAVHAVLVGFIVLSSLLRWNIPENRKTKISTSRPVTLRGLTAEQFERNRGNAQNIRDERKVIAKKEEKKKEEKKQPEKMPDGQIVDVPKGNEQVDPNAKYVAETSNKAQKETKAKEQTAFYRNAMEQRTAPQRIEGNGTAQTDKAQISGNNGMGTDDRPLKDKAVPKMAMQVPKVQRQQEVSLKRSTTEGPGVAVSNREETEEIKGNSGKLNLVPGSLEQGEDVSAGRVGQAGVLNLLPSNAVVDKIVGAAPNDHLKDVEEGDGTYLSTREWKYASFFNRMKQSVGQQWSPTSQMRLRDPTGQIYGGRDRYTILTITLDETGRLKDAFVDKSSGLDFLDLEAVKAFERAQPFPNPPPGILATDQTVRFQFGFFLELSGHPGMRLFRSQQ